MEFANSMYAAVTRQFFDFLVSNINKKFQERCQTLDERQYENDIDLGSYEEKKQTVENTSSQN